MNKHKIFDRNRLRLHRNRAARTIEQHNFLIELSGQDILQRLMSMDIAVNSVLEIGARTGFMTQKLMTNYPFCNIVATDISEAMLSLNPATNKILLDEEDMALLHNSLLCHSREGGNPYNHKSFVDCDMDPRLRGDDIGMKPEQEKFDIIVSNLNLHNINDIQKFFSNIAALLRPNGVFVASMFGGGSLVNLRSFLLQTEIATNSGHSPHISPFATAQDIYRLLQLAGFEFIVTDTHKVEVEYDSPLTCMHELRNMGESSTLIHGTRSLTKAILQKARYGGAFTDYAEIITLTASRGAVKTSF